MRALQRLGDPYMDADIEAAPAQLEGLMQVDAVVAYLQMLGVGFDPDASDEHGEGH